MPTFYIIKSVIGGKSYLVSTLVPNVGAYTALRLFRASETVTYSLLDKRQVDALCTNLGLTPAEALAALDIEDAQASNVRSLMIAPATIDGLTPVDGNYHILVTIGDYRIWQVTAPVENLLSLHNQLWSMPPAKMLGLLAVVQTFGASFHEALIKNYLEWDNPTWLGRRNVIAAYVNNHGGNGAAVAAATTEDALAKGIATGLGYTVEQLWSAMD